MSEMVGLAEYLDSWAGSDRTRLGVAQTVQAIAEVSVEVSELIADGDLAGALDRAVGENADGDTQKELDMRANDLFIAALRLAPVAVLGSEEAEDVISLVANAPLAVTLDPLDGSSNIATNVSVGSIFSILPTLHDAPPSASILQPGVHQLGAGFVIYGPQTTLALTLRDGTHIFTLSRRYGTYWQTTKSVSIPPDRREYAINGSNARHWDATVRDYVEQCQAGKEGPLGKDYNTRWVASLVAEAYRIFSRGGVFLYPNDRRDGYSNGRLRLVYEANPISLLVEQAGGKATNGRQAIMELQPQALHQRTPFVFGSADEVERIANKYAAAAIRR